MTIFILIFLLLLFIYSWLVDYYRRGWKSLSTPATRLEPMGIVSVVVAARNEEGSLPALLLSMAKQTYPGDKFEVIVVDDHSTDSTLEVLSQNEYQFSLKVLQLPLQQQGKKRAIELAVHAAKGQLIIQTDADCTMSPNWISCFAECYEGSGAKFIAAPVRIESNPTLLGIFQSLDFLTLQIITGASVQKRCHNMCNGANMAFERRAFFDAGAFAGIDSIPSGDDMLLMHKISERYPGKVIYLKDEAAIVETAPAKSWKEFFHQRIRWSSKAVHYKDKKLFYSLLLTYLLNACYLILAVAAVVHSYWLPFLLLLLLAKILIEFPLVNAGAIFFNQQHLMKWFPFLQPLHILYVITAGWLGRFGSYEWKSRIVKNKGAGNLAKQ